MHYVLHLLYSLRRYLLNVHFPCWADITLHHSQLSVTKFVEQCSMMNVLKKTRTRPASRAWPSRTSLPLVLKDGDGHAHCPAIGFKIQVRLDKRNCTVRCIQ